MPTVSRFFGTAIYIYRRDHGVPHFHARYCDEQASVAIETREILGGHLGARAQAMVIERA